LAAYLIIAALTAFAPKNLIPLAYDSGCVTISTVTVPIVTALGLGLASAVPGRDPALDGFGLIAFACLLPVITVLGYALFGQWAADRTRKNMLKKESGNAL
jgi:Na+/proline symporter